MADVTMEELRRLTVAARAGKRRADEALGLGQKREFHALKVLPEATGTAAVAVARVALQAVRLELAWQQTHPLPRR